MPASAPMKTGDGRFGYEAAGHPDLPPLIQTVRGRGFRLSVAEGGDA